MKKKMLLIPLVLLLIASLVACAAPAPAPAPVPTPAPAPAPTPAPVPTPKVYKWNMYYLTWASHPFTIILVDAFDKIERASNGRLQIQMVPFGETPFAGTDAPRLMREGLVEMVETLGQFALGDAPALGSMELMCIPPVDQRSTGAQTLLMDQLWQLPALKSLVEDTFSGWNAVYLGKFYWPPQQIWGTKPITEAADLEGLRIRTQSPDWSAFYTALGALPATVATGEVYTALERGMLDSVQTAATSITPDSAWGEVLKSGYIANLAISSSHISVNKEAWDTLTPDLQEILKLGMYSGLKGINDWAIANEAEILRVIVEEMGYVVTYASDEDYEHFREVAKKDVWPQWVAGVGPGGKELLNIVLSYVGEEPY